MDRRKDFERSPGGSRNDAEDGAGSRSSTTSQPVRVTMRVPVSEGESGAKNTCENEDKSECESDVEGEDIAKDDRV